MQSIHVSHENVFCIISFEIVLKTLGSAWGGETPSLIALFIPGRLGGGGKQKLGGVPQILGGGAVR